VRAVLDDPGPSGEARLEALRRVMEGQPFVPAVKHVLGQRGVPVRPDVRAPLQPLDAARAETLRVALLELGGLAISH
jgi:dihydrodipicolinate synthase/N-acetylneuraminate lyase